MCQLLYLPLDGSMRLSNHLILRQLRTGNIINSFLLQINYVATFEDMDNGLILLDIFQFEIATNSDSS